MRPDKKYFPFLRPRKKTEKYAWPRTAQKTSKAYSGFFQNAYGFFNQSLFDGRLPECMITTQRGKPCMGHFINDRWVKQDGKKTNEISLNPSYFASYPVLEIFQTLVHEMCHLWQYEFGKPSRGGYHNKEWVEKMCSVGLEPISLDNPGKGTGQRVSDKAIPDSAFMVAAKQFIDSHIAELWFDRFPIRSEYLGASTVGSLSESVKPAEIPNVESILEAVMGDLMADTVVSPSVAHEAVAKKRKTKFSCPGCGVNAWGKDSLKLVCGECDEHLIAG